MVLIAASLCQSAHLYIWDEPLNFVEIHSRIQIKNLIRSFQLTMPFPVVGGHAYHFAVNSFAFMERMCYTLK